jgi:L-threonylcarbamoyladenylate synthase
VGVESTILGLLDGPQLLRPGGVAVEDLEALLGPLALGGSEGKPNAPGQLASHYAPAAPVRLEARDIRDAEIRLGFGPGEADLHLSRTGDLVEAAANLFHLLREADRLAQGRSIAVAPVPEAGLGRAINDRLRRAAAPRV